MRARVRFDPAARRELLEAADFYDIKSAGLGSKFVDAVESALAQAERFPESCPIEMGETRKLVLGRFPYSIMYWLDGSTIVVLAIAHQHRRPDYWGERE